jgi:membrane protein
MRRPRWHRSAALAGATLRGAGAHGLTIGAAGCAFFTVLALFPALSLLIEAYGLWLNPRGVAAQLAALEGLLPRDAYVLIERWLRYLVLHSRATLQLGVGLSTLITLFSAASGTRALLATLAATHGGGAAAGTMRQHLLALLVTMAAIGVAIVAVALLTLMPILAAMLGMQRLLTPVLHVAGTVALLTAGAVFLGVLYRIALPGPTLATGGRRNVWPGVVLATALWLLASWLVSFYADHLARLATTYGPIGAVVALMLWLYATFYAALIGAELNAQLDRAADADARAPVPELRIAQ